MEFALLKNLLKIGGMCLCLWFFFVFVFADICFFLHLCLCTYLFFLCLHLCTYLVFSLSSSLHHILLICRSVTHTAATRSYRCLATNHTYLVDYFFFIFIYFLLFLSYFLNDCPATSHTFLLDYFFSLQFLTSESLFSKRLACNQPYNLFFKPTILPCWIISFLGTDIFESECDNTQNDTGTSQSPTVALQPTKLP